MTLALKKCPGKIIAKEFQTGPSLKKPLSRCKLYSQGVNVYILYLQFLRESKVTTNSARTETGLLTNNVASACDELVHSKAVTAVEDKRFCIFIWHIFLVPVKTSFFEHELSSDTCGVTSALPISIDQYMVHGCASLKFHYREMRF